VNTTERCSEEIDLVQGVRSDLLEAALGYAARGWYVLPVRPDKSPATPNGVKDATNDPDIIREWWADQPDANIGVACGPSGIFVVDLDVNVDLATGIVKDGIGAWKSLASEYGFPEGGTLTSMTPSGGQHLVYTMPSGDPLGNSAGKLAPGVDTRGNSGYIVAPPSVTPGGIYSWQDETAAIAACPAGLALLLRVKETRLWEESRITLAQMVSTALPPTAWLVERTLEAGTLVVGYGQPGCMKSMLFADMAVCVAAGIPWLGGLRGCPVPC